MSALSMEQYRRLERLAREFSDRHLRAFKARPEFHPRLVVDALCFAPCPGRPGWLVGAWLTPCDLSLALVRESAEACDTDTAGPQVLELPRGEFELEPEIMAGDILWRCLLLNDLGDVDDMGEACRLAQRLMDKVMTAPE